MSRKRKAQVGKNCVACGNCVKYCNFAAITIYRGLYAVVDQNRCVGCGKCIAACPADVMKLIEKGEKTA